MVIDRVGNWAWALTPAERLVSIAVTTAQREGMPVGPRLARRHDAMRAKQAKLLARGYLPSGPHGFGNASRGGGAAPPPSAPDPAPTSAAWNGAPEEVAHDEPVD